jgi:thioredoxin reductase (NADPH)
MAEHDLHAVAFPRLDEAQMVALERCSLAKLKRYVEGEKLFEAGGRDFKFFVVKSGKVEIVDESGDTPKIVTVHGPGEFTGDVAQLTGSPSLVSGVARGECEVYEVSPDALRQILNNHPDLGDLILQAFLARRELLKELPNFMGLRVIGSRYSRDTFRVRDFLAKNRCPSRGLTWRWTLRWTRSSNSSGLPRPTRRWSPGAASCFFATPRTVSWRRRSASAARPNRPCTTW